jgi:hypothetical protein
MDCASRNPYLNSHYLYMRTQNYLRNNENVNDKFLKFRGQIFFFSNNYFYFYDIFVAFRMKISNHKSPAIIEYVIQIHIIIMFAYKERKYLI